MAQDPEIVRDEQAYQAFLTFLRVLTVAQSLAEVSVAAGVMLQELEEEPDGDL